MKRYIWKVKEWIALRLLFNALYILVVAGIPYIIKIALDYDYSKGYKDILSLIIVYIGIVIISTISQYLSQVSGWKMDKKFFLLIKHDMFCAITKRENMDFKEKSVEEYVSILNNDIPTLQEYMESIILIIEDITQIVIYAVYLLLLDYPAAIIIMLSSVSCLFLPNVTGKKLSRKRKRYLDSIGQYINKISDLLYGFSDINKATKKSFQREEYKSLEHMEQLRLKYGKFRAFTIVLNGFFMYLLDITAFLTVVISLLVQRITVGTASALLSYINDFTFPIKDLISSISAVKSTQAVKKEIFTILSYTETEKKSVSQFKEAIKFNTVTVKWENFCLKNFTYCFQKGRKYAIIGHSGSGKSTLFHLLMQQEYPDLGSITIDNKNSNELEYSSIISYISQKEHIFKESFENNVTVFQSYRKRGVQEVLSFIRSERLQTLVQKEDCSTLSGGEKNLLSIVKVLIMDKEILLLDEIFSALDFNTKCFLQEKIYRELSNTMLVITHDISPENLKYFDEILIMKDGRLICSGLKEEVLDSKEYRDLLQI